MDVPVSLPSWYEENRELFKPPICNKIMHKDQLTVMFVGGPNKRRDFHLDRGSEFFYQMKGKMQLPIILPGKKLVLVEIGEGEVFLLPSTIPHSPQRPETESLGMVIERARYAHEPDGLRYFTGFDWKSRDVLSENDVEEVLWEKFFHLKSLEEDLVPVVQEFMASEECAQNKVLERKTVLGQDHCPFPENVRRLKEVPKPFSLAAWTEERLGELDGGAESGETRCLPLFQDHPDREFEILVCGAGEHEVATRVHEEVIGAEARDADGNVLEPCTVSVETFLFQERGECRVELGNEGSESFFKLEEKGCFVLPGDGKAKLRRDKGAITLLIRQYPGRNEKELP